MGKVPATLILAALVCVQGPRALAEQFTLAEEKYPDEIAALLLARETSKILTAPATKPCPVVTGEDRSVCAPDAMKAREAVRKSRTTQVVQQIDAPLRARYAALTDAKNGLGPAPSACYTSMALVARRAAAITAFKTALAARTVPSDQIGARWLAALGDGATWDSELPEAELRRLCASSKPTLYPPLASATVGALRPVLYDPERGAALLRSGCAELARGPSSDGPNRMRSLLVAATVPAIADNAGDLDLASRMVTADAYKTADAAKDDAPGLMPRACPKGPMSGDQQAACGCAAQRFKEERESAFNTAAQARLQPVIDQVAGHISSTLASSKLSPALRATLAAELAPGKIGAVSVSPDMTEWQAFAGAADRRLHASPTFMAMVGVPGYDTQVRATIGHELGHDLEFLLGRSKEMCRTPVSAQDSPGCAAAARVQATMSPADVALFSRMRDCLDRNFLYGEWVDSRARFPALSVLPWKDTFAAKRAEYFGDAFMRVELAREPGGAKASALSFLCDAAPETESGVSDGHPTTRYRFANALNTGASTGGAGDSQTPPYACEQALFH